MRMRGARVRRIRIIVVGLMGWGGRRAFLSFECTGYPVMHDAWLGILIWGRGDVVSAGRLVGNSLSDPAM